MARSILTHLGLVGLALLAGLNVHACTKSDERDPSAGQAMQTDPRASGDQTGTATGANGGTGTGANGGTGTGANGGGTADAGGTTDTETVDSGSVGTDPGGTVDPNAGGGGTADAGATDAVDGTQVFGKTLEQCTVDKKAWIAVVQGGTQPATCGEALVNWCCVQADVLARFPAQSGALKQRFDKNTGEGFKLYHCSTDGANRTTFHFGKIEPTTTSYRTVYVEKVFPVDITNPTSPCPELTTNDLKTTE